MALPSAHNLAALGACLESMGSVAVAVSGGVDSMTLAVVAHDILGDRAQMCHAISAAVPPDATERVRDYAARRGWRLTLVESGEFDDTRYISNPANRCFYCKTRLYESMAALTRAVLVSGTNLDDLGDYRPGLRAAADHAVRHPYVQVGIDKDGVRRLARLLGCADLAELPAAPCLSSRVETHIAIEADALGVINAVETLLREALNPATVRCRLRHTTIGIELDGSALAALSPQARRTWGERIAAMFRAAGLEKPVAFELYRMGSAFLRPHVDL